MPNTPPIIETINVSGGSTQIDSVGYTDGQTTYLSNPFASDADGDQLTWSIVGGADADKFTIDSGDGFGPSQIFWVTPPNFDPQREISIDGSRQFNPYHLTIQVDDGQGGIDTQDITVGMAQNPWFPFVFEGAEPTSVELAENGTAVTTVHAEDNLGGFFYSIDPNVGDASLFQVDPSTGVVSFINAPDFENPQDVDNGMGSRDNIYDLAVLATDLGGGGGDPGSTSSQALRVHVDNVGPVIDSYGGDNHAVLNVVENTVGTVATVTTAADSGQLVNFSIDPTFGDFNKFQVDSSGHVSFITAPDFEHPTDVSVPGDPGGDGAYNVRVVAQDQNGALDTQDFLFQVTDNPADNVPVSKGQANKGDVTLSGLDGDDVLTGGKGNDLLSGHGGNDKLDGDAGNDNIFGGVGRDTIIGGNGDDNLIGNQGDDNISGGAGKDIIAGGPDNNTIDGGADKDYALFAGNKTDYTLTFDKKGVLTTITDSHGDITLVKNVEVFHFEDGGTHNNYQVDHGALVVENATNNAADNNYLASHGATHDWIV